MKRSTVLPGALLKTRGKAFPAFFLALACLLPVPRAAVGQNMPLDDKARYERSLEAKVGEVLLKLLGPNQAQVVVQASMDFTRTEKVDMTSKTAETAVKESMFKWDSASPENQISAEYLLPGFPSMVAGGAKPESTTYQKQMLYPASFIKKLTVTVILNKTLPDSEGQSVRNVVSEILSMDPERGDELIIIKAPFAPFWRTVWYNPESMGLLFKYGILTVMGIIAMIVVAIGFLKLAGAMNTMAKAQQGHQITMDLGKNIPGMPGGPEPGGLGPGGPGERGQGQDGESGSKTEGEEVVIDIALEKIPFLVKMMTGEDPANVALVAGHLAQPLRNEFFKKLPAAFASDVMISMAKIRFIDPEIIVTLKDELERRLSGAVGGLDGVLSAIGNANLAAKRIMLSELTRKQPELAAEVRKQILMPDDLALFSERDLSLVISVNKVEDWSTALFGLSEAVRQKIKGQMAARTWQMLEQSMSYGTPSAEKAEEAVERIMLGALKMIKEGRIKNPLEEAKPVTADKTPALSGGPAETKK